MKVKEGDIIILAEQMENEIRDGKYHGVPVGARGTVQKVQKWVDGTFHLMMKWDEGYGLNIILPEDKIKIIERDGLKLC